MFYFGDKVYHKDKEYIWTVEDIDVDGPIPRYKLVQGEWSFWDYCVGWEKLVTPDEALKYGKVLTDDLFEKKIIDDSGWDLIKIDYIRIRTIIYDNCIFYYKTINEEPVEFKELKKN